MNKPDKAFILAAGKGTRLKPYTDKLPKPMVTVAGKPIIDHIIDKLVAESVKTIVINLHHFGNKLEGYLKSRTDVKIIFTHEPMLLDTGGGIRNGLRHFDDTAFYAINGDAFWTDGPGLSALERLWHAWDEEKMDLLLLLEPLDKMTLTKGIGDYHLKEDGKIQRALDQKGNAMFTSIRIVKPQIFRNTPEGPFSFLEIMDKCEKQNKLYGLLHDADWHHISTPEELERVNAAFREKHA